MADHEPPLLFMSRALRVDCKSLVVEGAHAYLAAGARSPPHGDPRAGWVHKHNLKTVVQDILVACFKCYLLDLSLCSFLFSSLVGVLVVLVSGAGLGELRSSHKPPLAFVCIGLAHAPPSLCSSPALSTHTNTAVTKQQCTCKSQQHKNTSYRGSILRISVVEHLLLSWLVCEVVATQRFLT